MAHNDDEGCNWWSCQPKLTLSVISRVKPIIYTFIYVNSLLLFIKNQAPDCYPRHITSLINQSINQSNFYSANIPGVARLSGSTDRSVFKCEVVEVVP